MDIEYTPLIQCDRCERMVPAVSETWLGEVLCPECEAELYNRRKALQNEETRLMEEEQELNERRALGGLEGWDCEDCDDA